jgi:hypothetical protein
MSIGRGNRSTWRKPACPNVTFSTANFYRLSPNIANISEAMLDMLFWISNDAMDYICMT